MDLSRRQFVTAAAALAAGAGHTAVAQDAAQVMDAGSIELQFNADGVYDSFREQGFFVIRREGRIFVLSSVCTHKGCKVRAQDDQSFFCKCHKSAFDPTGKVLNGPAPRSLPRLAIKVDGNGHLLVDVDRKLEQP